MREQDGAAAKVTEMFGTAVQALAILWRVAPQQADAITLFLIDEFTKLREQHVGS